MEGRKKKNNDNNYSCTHNEPSLQALGTEELSLGAVSLLKSD